MNEAFEKIKERLEKDVISLEDNYGDLVECIPSEVVFEIINQVAEEYNNGWIPCSDRLPETRQVILATIFVKSQQRRFVSQIMYSDWWLEGDATMIAWQPMPESYKEEVDQ